MSDTAVTIRVATQRDAEALRAIYAPYVQETAVTFEYDIPSVAEFARRIGDTLQRYPYLAAECAGTVVGYAYAGPFQSRPAYDWSVETSIYVGQGHRRQGVGSSLYGALEAALRAQGILNINACIACAREADPFLPADSIPFHEQAGFRPVGRFHKCGYKFERWYDILWMEKHIGPHSVPPQSVRWADAVWKNMGFYQKKRESMLD